MPARQRGVIPGVLDVEALRARAGHKPPRPASQFSSETLPGYRVVMPKIGGGYDR
jgi:hypothetical protein